jgi:hypothetical protein
MHGIMVLPPWRDFALLRTYPTLYECHTAFRGISNRYCDSQFATLTRRQFGSARCSATPFCGERCRINCNARLHDGCAVIKMAHAQGTPLSNTHSKKYSSFRLPFLNFFRIQGAGHGICCSEYSLFSRIPGRCLPPNALCASLAHSCAKLRSILPLPVEDRCKRSEIPL